MTQYGSKSLLASFVSVNSSFFMAGPHGNGGWYFHSSMGVPAASFIAEA